MKARIVIAFFLALGVIAPCNPAYSEALPIYLDYQQSFKDNMEKYDRNKQRHTLDKLREISQKIEELSFIYERNAIFTRNISDVFRFKACTIVSLEDQISIAKCYYEIQEYKIAKEIYRNIVTRYSGYSDFLSYVKTAEFGLEDIRNAEFSGYRSPPKVTQQSPSSKVPHSKNRWVGEYQSDYGKLIIKDYSKTHIVFDIKTSGDGVSLCSQEDAKATISGNSARFNIDECLIVLVNQGNSIKVITKNCQGFCGFRSMGTMDGIFRKQQ